MHTYIHTYIHAVRHPEKIAFERGVKSLPAYFFITWTIISGFMVQYMVVCVYLYIHICVTINAFNSVLSFMICMCAYLCNKCVCCNHISACTIYRCMHVCMYVCMYDL